MFKRSTYDAINITKDAINLTKDAINLTNDLIKRYEFTSKLEFRILRISKL